MRSEPKTTSRTLGPVDGLGFDLFDFVDFVGLFGAKVGPLVAVTVAIKAAMGGTRRLKLRSRCHQ
jgi:hypothetical protein